MRWKKAAPNSLGREQTPPLSYTLGVWVECCFDLSQILDLSLKFMHDLWRVKQMVKMEHTIVRQIGKYLWLITTNKFLSSEVLI